MTSFFKNIFRSVFRPKTIRNEKLIQQFSDQVPPSSKLFFFFPFYHVGGAEQVHLDIVKAVSVAKPIVIFTSNSDSDAFLPRFAEVAICIDLGKPISDKRVYKKALDIVANELNRQKSAVVFGCNSFFFYDLLPFLNEGTVKIDLLHAFSDNGLENYSIPFVKYLDKRVVINERTKEDFKALYEAKGVDANFVDRIIKIVNGTSLPEGVRPKLFSNEEPLNVLYVGRGSSEKRVWLVAQIAKELYEREVPCKFTLVGNLQESIPDPLQQYCTLTGEIKDPALLAKLYSAADVLLITSIREGFPMVVMEAMAYGCVPVCTDVGGISEHIVHQINGFLIPSHSEEEIVRDFSQALEKLYGDPELRQKLSESAKGYAFDNFGMESFERSYQALLINNRQH